MKFKKTGGPAFPFEYHNQTAKPQESFVTDGLVAPNGAEQYGGLSIRDYFAAKAMQSMVAAEFNMSVQAKYWAEEAYRVADAVLAAGGHNDE